MRSKLHSMLEGEKWYGEKKKSKVREIGYSIEREALL